MKTRFSTWMFATFAVGIVSTLASAANVRLHNHPSLLGSHTALQRIANDHVESNSSLKSPQLYAANNSTFRTNDRPPYSRDSSRRDHQPHRPAYRDDYPRYRDYGGYRGARGNDYEWHSGREYIRYEGNGLVYESITYPNYSDRYYQDNQRSRIPNRSWDNLPRRVYPNR